MEFQWHDIDSESGGRRDLRAERFAGVWSFKYRLHRRGDWTKGLVPTRAMWEHILESLERRYWRREGVEQKDLDQVKKILQDLVRLEELRNS